MGESVSDYAGFDFLALWKGRGRVTEVEREIVRRALLPADHRRILEVGTGFGRLLGTLTALGQEVVATDFDRAVLGKVPEKLAPREPLRVAANLYHLPFVDGAFTSASMVRVYHHLTDPVSALTELGRVLRAGARLVLSYNPRPSVGTFVQDVRRALEPARTGTRFRSATFARGSVTLPPAPFPVEVPDRRTFARTVRAAGFDPRAEVVAGMEEYRIARRAPAALFVHLGFAIGRAPGFPVRFAVLERTGTDAGPLPGPDAILACPRCRAALPFPEDDREISCDRCGPVGARSGHVIDLRFVPEGVPRWKGAAG